MELDTDLIWEWLRVSDHPNTTQLPAFFDFIAVWIAFNAFYNSKSSDRTKGDRWQINKFSGRPEVIAAHKNLLNETNYRKAVTVLQEKGILDLRYMRRNSISDAKNTTEVLLSLYTIRNNLFHGGKQFTVNRDQKLVEAAKIITSSLLKRLFMP